MEYSPTRLVHRALEGRVMMPQDASCLGEAMPEAGDSSVEVCRRKTVRVLLVTLWLGLFIFYGCMISFPQMVLIIGP